MSQKKEECSSSSDESLDLTSVKFDPLRALYSRKTKVPVPNAMTLDNIAAYESMRKRIEDEERGVMRPPKKSFQGRRPSTTDQSNVDKPTNVETAGTSRTESDSGSLPTVRRFLPHQQMIPAKKKAPKMNLLSRMPAAQPPFQRLWETMEGPARSRVRVVTRDACGVHGRLEGYVELFDKHWNLALSDVTEVFYRSAPARAKDYFQADDIVREVTSDLAELCVSQPVGRGRGRGRGRGHVGAGPTTGLPQPADLVPLRELQHGRGKGRGKRSREELADWIPLPKVFYRACGKRQECVRHIGQLFVRGEHVVFVQVLTVAEQSSSD